MRKRNNTENNSKKSIKFGRIFALSKKKILALVVLLIIIASAIYYGINGRFSITNKPASTSEIDDNSYNQSRIMRVDLNKIKSINFDLATCDVRILRSTTNPYVEYTVLYRGDDHVYNMDVSFHDGELRLKNKIVGKELYMKDKIPIVRIFLPMKGGLDAIKGKITAGDVKITDLEVKNFDLSVQSGNVSIDNSHLQGAITNNAGSISLNKAEISNTKLSTNTGNINIVDSSLGNRLDLSSQTGDIVVEANKSIDKYNISARLGVGNFILGNISYRNIKDGYSSGNKGKYNISMKTKIGDIIFNRGEGARIEKEEFITNDRSDSSKEESSDDKKEKDEDKENDGENQGEEKSDDEDMHNHDHDKNDDAPSGDKEDGSTTDQGENN